MQGPLWAQIAIFFAVAVPAVLLVTHVCMWLFARFLKKPHVEKLEELYPTRDAFLADVIYTPIDDVLARCAGRVRMITTADVRNFRTDRPYRRKSSGKIVLFKGDKDGEWGLFMDLEGHVALHGYSDLVYALPRPGEYWSVEMCLRHKRAILEVVLVNQNSEWLLDEEREEEIRCGCLKPVADVTMPKA